MIATLTFDLNDPDQRVQHLRCIKALDLALAVQELSGLYKKILDKEDNLDKDLTARQLKDFIKRYTWEVLEDNNLTNIDEFLN